MNDLKELLDREARRVSAEPDALDTVLGLRDRRRRNQRIAAGVVGIAVFVAAIWIVTTGGPFDRARTPASGGDAPLIPVPGAPEVDSVLDLDTGAMTPLPDAILRSLGAASTGDGAGSRYALSPDGSSLAYVAPGEDGTSQIFVAPALDGSGVRQVTHDPAGADWPAWSPDGTMIAYEGGGDVRDLFVLDLITGGSTRIDDGAPYHQSLGEGLQFTPDGSSLIYTGGTYSVPELRTVPIAGGDSTVVFGLGRGGMVDASNGSMSPDGSLVTMMGSVGDGGAFRFVARVDGAEPRQIVGRRSEPAGTWSPDGTRIVCRGPGDLDWVAGIIVVDIATGESWPVAEGHAAIWLDDHTLLIDV